MEEEAEVNEPMGQQSDDQPNGASGSGVKRKAEDAEDGDRIKRGK